MPSQGSYSSSRRVEAWVTLALCAAVFAASAVQQFAGGRGHPLNASTPDWVPLAAAGLGAAGIVPSGRSRWVRARRALLWSGLLLMVWATQGLPLDALRVTGLIPLPVDWPGLATKTLALAAAVVLAHHALVSLPAPGSRGPAVWYGYAAFALTLPYPVLRAWWALGGTTGLSRPGAAGEGYAPLVLAVPWLLAGALSLLLVPTWRRMPRRLLLTAGWTATTMVAMVGPGACWAVVTRLLEGAPTTPPGVEPSGISLWVFALVYGSWFLWAIAAGAATRSYQLRSARRGDALADAAARVGA